LCAVKYSIYSVSRMKKLIVPTLFLLLGFLLPMVPALASHQYWAVDDSCGTGGSNYFFPNGPAAGWHVHSGGGYQGNCHMWTWPVCNSCAPEQRASWYLPTNSAHTGNYNVRIWNDCENHFDNTAVKYQRFANGTGGGVTQTYTFNQEGNPCDSIQHVGQGQFNGPNGGYMKLIDSSTNTTGEIGVDHLRYVPVAH
jgi:hypothetical protein